MQILTSGCGITYSRQQHKTWANVLQTLGCNIIDVSGPAVSNQWILNKVILKLHTATNIDMVIIQLSGLEKLDVEVDHLRIQSLVVPDDVRNFVIQDDQSVTKGNDISEGGTWPSSGSQQHESKQLWRKWLFSPKLELENIICKLLLLSDYCNQRQIKLYVFHGYALPWTEEQKLQLKNIIVNLNDDFYTDYQQSPYYKLHDFTYDNSVPCLPYMVKLATKISEFLPLQIQHRLSKITPFYDQQ